MKLNKSFEQATYVIIILALQKEHHPVKSRVLSQVLRVSDSYLKKILVKLSKAGLISANASKVGVYQLAKSVDEISLKNIFFALNLQINVLDFKHIDHQIYDDVSHVREVEEKITTTLEAGLSAFYRQLDTLTILDLLYQEAYKNGVIDWNEYLVN